MKEVVKEVVKEVKEYEKNCVRARIKNSKFN